MANNTKDNKPTKSNTSSNTKFNTSTSEQTQPAKTNVQSIVIAVLVTILVCAGILFAVLAGTGVIKFGDSTSSSGGSSSGQSTTTDKIISNTYPKVSVHDATLAKVQDLEFYLPDDFKAGGKNDSGAYTYNLVDDDGWAQVLVYAEKTNLTPEKYLAKISPYLEITDQNYQMYGTTWVQAENANSLAYATELDGTVYAVYYAVKLDSDDTAEAMSMIPKTLYMNKIYSNN